MAEPFDEDRIYKSAGANGLQSRARQSQQTQDDSNSGMRRWPEKPYGPLKRRFVKIQPIRGWKVIISDCAKAF
jgi:hypothetical protein